MSRLEHFDLQVAKEYMGNHKDHQLFENRATLLIVDDEDDLLQLLAKELSDQYHVFIANSGQAALAILEHSKVEVILTDHFMPSMTGIQLLRQSQQLQPDVVGILVSGALDQDIFSQAINMSNVCAFITKPFDFVEIREHLESVLRDHCFDSCKP